MVCQFCGKIVGGNEEYYDHQACRDKRDQRLSLDQCAYCGKQMDDSMISTDHCKNEKYLGY